MTVVVANSYPNFSISGIPHCVSGEVGHWSNPAPRTHADLAATGMRLWLDTRVTGIDLDRKAVTVRKPNGSFGTPSDRPTACTCCTRWATRSP